MNDPFWLLLQTLQILLSFWYARCLISKKQENNDSLMVGYIFKVILLQKVKFEHLIIKNF